MAKKVMCACKKKSYKIVSQVHFSKIFAEFALLAIILIMAQ